MPDKKPTWIAVVDPQRAKIFADYGAIDRTHPVFGGEFTNPPALGYTVSINARPRDEARRHFLVNIAAFVGEAAEEDRFDRLIVIAPPSMIDDLRTSLANSGSDRLFQAAGTLEFVATDEERLLGS